MHWTDHPLLRLNGAGALGSPLLARLWEHLGKEGSLGGAVKAYHQTSATKTKPSTLVERLRCTCPGASWSLWFEPRTDPGQRRPAPDSPYPPPAP